MRVRYTRTALDEILPAEISQPHRPSTKGSISPPTRCFLGLVKFEYRKNS